MINTVLYLATIFIWGGSWLAIKWQAGPVPVPQAILHRFGLAALLMMGLALALGKLQKSQRRDHLFFVLQGACLFSLNFIAFYQATYHIASGLVAVVMSTATLFNAVHNRLLWNIKPSSGFSLGAPLGILGLILLFWEDVTAGGWSASTLAGVGLSLLGTWFFSLGNMVSVRHSRRGLQPVTTNAWAMCYGCGILLVIVLFSGQPFVWDGQPRYLGALLYLALFASVLGFTAYLMLVGNIGANSASYTLVATPLVALTLSSVFEGYQWSATGALGLLFIIAGNVVVLGRYEIKLPGRAQRSPI